MSFLPFLAVSDFLCILKNTYKNNNYASIVLKAKTEIKIKKKLVDPKIANFLVKEK